MKINTSLPHNSICYMTNFYFTVYCYDPVFYWTKPDIVITFTVAYEITAMFMKDFAYLFFVIRHYAITAWASILNDREIPI